MAYINRVGEYVVNPSPGQHLMRAPSVNIRDIDESSALQKLQKCLEIAEQYGCKKVNIHLVGSANENPSGVLDNIIKNADGLGFINTPRALKGEINRPYHWTGISDIKEKYLPKIKELNEFGVAFDNFCCAHCAALDHVSEAIQVAGNDNGVTILYNGVEEEKINKVFQRLFDEGIVQIL